tara:strand:- start:36 stop:326 length:291 start_codon:yes stop_codon:yes gene_type:complete
MINKLLIFIFLLLFISSCTGNTKRSQKSDEFLIEKKNPLVMPPNIDELPKPKEDLADNTDDNGFKQAIQNKNPENQSSNIEDSGTLQESIIKKIEQ